MKVRGVVESDLPEIARWFERRRWPFPAIPEIFPETGVVAFDGDTLLACAWVYETGTSLAFIEWTATNPDVQDSKGMRALSQVLDKLKEWAQMGPKVKALVHFVSNDKLSGHYEKLGFRKTDGYSRVLWRNRE